jgi:hypothetical protein
MSRRIVSKKEVETQNSTAAALYMTTMLSNELYKYPEAQGFAGNVLPTPSATPAAADDYMTKLVKYIPTEIVAVYLFISGILKNLAPNAVLDWGVFVLLLVLTPVYIWRVTKDPQKSPAWDQLVVSFVSFAVWVFALGGPFAAYAWYNPLYGSILVALFTLIAPIIKR